MFACNDNSLEWGSYSGLNLPVPSLLQNVVACAIYILRLEEMGTMSCRETLHMAFGLDTKIDLCGGERVKKMSFKISACSGLDWIGL